MSDPKNIGETLMRILTAKSGDRIGDYELDYKAVENDCFGWWCIDRLSRNRGFISVPNLVIVANKEES